MKKNVVLKIILIFISIITISMFFINNFGYAAVTANGGGTGETAIGEFTGQNPDTEIKNPLINFLGALRNVFQVVSLGVAIIMLTVLAIKYMVSSVEEKAEIKKHAYIYVIGAILIFATNGIISIIQAFSKNID